MKIFRPQPNITLEDILATDSESDLLKAYLRNFRKNSGKAISDVALVKEELSNWSPIDAADAIIPFNYSWQVNEPSGNRIWYLSQKPKSIYYNGWFFDYQVSITGTRKIRKNCRLSKNALALFEHYPEIKKHEKPSI